MEIAELEFFSTFIDAVVKHWDLSNTPIESNELRKRNRLDCESLSDEMKSLWSNAKHELSKTFGNFQEFTQAKKTFQKSIVNQNTEQSIRNLLIARIDKEMEKWTAMESDLNTVSLFFESISDKSTTLVPCLERNSNICSNWFIYIRRCLEELYEMRSLHKFYGNLKEKFGGAAKTTVDAQALLVNNIVLFRVLRNQAEQSENRFISSEAFTERVLARDESYLNFRKSVLKFVLHLRMVFNSGDNIFDTLS